MLRGIRMNVTVGSLLGNFQTRTSAPEFARQNCYSLSKPHRSSDSIGYVPSPSLCGFTRLGNGRRREVLASTCAEFSHHLRSSLLRLRDIQRMIYPLSLGRAVRHRHAPCRYKSPVAPSGPHSTLCLMPLCRSLCSFRPLPMGPV